LCMKVNDDIYCVHNSIRVLTLGGLTVASRRYRLGFRIELSRLRLQLWLFVPFEG